jgi:hypothetical protein
MDRLECTLSRLAETMERVAKCWEEDLKWRQSHGESWLSPVDLYALQQSLIRGQRIARRLSVIAAKFVALDAQTT